MNRLLFVLLWTCLCGGVGVACGDQVIGKPTRECDQELARTIAEKLKPIQSTDARFHVDIIVDQGQVWLRGRTQTKAQRYLMVHLAEQVTGVVEVMDELTVQSTGRLIDRTAAKSIGDMDLAEQVAAKLLALKAQRQIKNFDIDIEVSGGTLWLRGTVEDAVQQQLILDTTRRVAGIKQVVNDLHRPKSKLGATTMQSHRGDPFLVIQLDQLRRQRSAIDDRIAALEAALGPRPPEPPRPNSRRPYPAAPAWPYYPAYNYWGSTQKLNWQDGWWYLDFKSK